MNKDEVLREYSINLKTFTGLKNSQMEFNLTAFRKIFWMINDANNINANLIPIRVQDRKNFNHILEMGYKAGYMDALK